MWPALKPGTSIADSFVVLEMKAAMVPPDIASHVMSGTCLNLDARYENSSSLIQYSLSPSAPPVEKWPFILPHGLSDIVVEREWRPTRIPLPSRAWAFKARTPPDSNRIAIVEIMARQRSTLFIAIVTWQGIPVFNRFTVGFKPGMAERTEALLFAGMAMDSQ